MYRVANDPVKPMTILRRELPMADHNQILETFERWGPMAFVIGGIGLLGTTLVGSLVVAGVVASSPRLAMGPLLFGLWFVFVGLLGFYPNVAEPSPRLSRSGLLTSGIAWIVWTVTLLAAIVVDLTSGRTIADPGSWGPPLLTVGFLLALLSFLVLGIASVRSETPSRTVGLLLLVPAVAFLGQAVLLISKIVSGEVLSVLQLAIGGIIGIVLIAVGRRLRTAAEPSSRTESETDAAA
jgi:hypothetical protein